MAAAFPSFLLRRRRHCHYGRRRRRRRRELPERAEHTRASGLANMPRAAGPGWPAEQYTSPPHHMCSPSPPPSSCAAEGRPFTICGGIKGRYFKARKQTSKLMLCCRLSQRKCSLDSFPTMPFVSVLARTHPTSSIVRRRWQHQTTRTVKWSSARMASTMAAAAADIQCSELDLGRDPTDPSGE